MVTHCVVTVWCNVCVECHRDKGDVCDTSDTQGVSPTYTPMHTQGVAVGRFSKCCDTLW